MAADLFRVRSTDVSYRISFDEIDTTDPALGEKLVEIIREFNTTELRLSCEGRWTSISAFVSVPADVTIEAIDAKAEALRTRWGRG